MDNLRSLIAGTLFYLFFLVKKTRLPLTLQLSFSLQELSIHKRLIVKGHVWKLPSIQAFMSFCFRAVDANLTVYLLQNLLRKFWFYASIYADMANVLSSTL